ncbi:protein ALP1-like [Selaginella moellendorffii]|uniref:protein ALP1-like n=1 Tax=Selaginella moellendorffii TaxID=88036 RepID=UPI000D1C69BB|nr:protein ALP1-like [Selaginella moellendorffii]|eukprot:XP_024529119.1 protein ALP1-like [Selaginella moellendorffii]
MQLRSFHSHVVAATSSSQQPQLERIWWVKPRSTVWFDRFVDRYYDDMWWKENFGMKKQTFNNLVDCLHDSIVKQNTHYRMAILVRVRVACAIYKFRHGSKLLSLSERFGIGKSTAFEVIKETCAAILEVFANVIKFPTSSSDLKKVIDGFQGITKLPNVAGCIDGSQIEIERPWDDPEVYFKHHRYSITLQAIVDSKKRFLDICCGWPGTVHDGRVWKNSSFRQRVLLGEVLQQPVMEFPEIPDVSLKPYLLGDKGYPCNIAIMTPFRRSANLSKFQILSSKIRMQPSDVVDVIYACCLLHNYLIDSGDANVDEEIEELNLHQAIDEDDRDNAGGGHQNEADGEELQEKLLHYLSRA